jgi:hypothetical protein
MFSRKDKKSPEALKPLGLQEFRAAVNKLVDQARRDNVRPYLIADCLDAAATGVRVQDAATKSIW